MDNATALKLINQGFDFEGNYQKVIFHINCMGKSEDEAIEQLESLADFKCLYEITPVKKRYQLMKKMKYRIMDIMGDEVEKGLLSEGEYIAGCNNLKRIYT